MTSVPIYLGCSTAIEGVPWNVITHKRPSKHKMNQRRCYMWCH